MNKKIAGNDDDDGVQVFVVLVGKKVKAHMLFVNFCFSVRSLLYFIIHFFCLALQQMLKKLRK